MSPSQIIISDIHKKFQNFFSILFDFPANYEIGIYEPEYTLGTFIIYSVIFEFSEKFIKFFDA